MMQQATQLASLVFLTVQWGFEAQWYSLYQLTCLSVKLHVREPDWEDWELSVEGWAWFSSRRGFKDLWFLHRLVDVTWGNGYSMSVSELAHQNLLTTARWRRTHCRTSTATSRKSADSWRKHVNFICRVGSCCFHQTFPIHQRAPMGVYCSRMVMWIHSVANYIYTYLNSGWRGGGPGPMYSAGETWFRSESAPTQ